MSTSIRAKFGSEDPENNVVHGASSEEQAEKEIEFFFPKEQTVAMIKPNAIESKGKFKKCFKLIILCKIHIMLFCLLL